MAKVGAAFTYDDEESFSQTTIDSVKTHSDFDAVYMRYSRYVATIAYRILGRSDDVPEIVQDVFLAAFGKLDTDASAERIKGWLATVTVRKARRRLRRQKFLNFLTKAPAMDAPDWIFADPALPAEKRVLLHEIYRHLQILPVGDRIAWTLRYLDGEPLERVAELCGCSLATAKRRISAAEKALAEVVDG